MKTVTKYLILIISLIYSTSVLGQDTTKIKLVNTVYFGYPATILDPPNFGFYVAYNPHFKFKKYFDYEFLLSYGYGSFKKDNDWFSHNGGHVSYGNLLSGIRFYYNSSGSKIRPYINLLIGVMYYEDKQYNYDNSLMEYSGFGMGISSGIYLQLYHKYNIGIALETYSSIVLKGGLNF